MKRFLGTSAMLLAAFVLCFSFTFSAVTFAPKALAQESAVVAAPSAVVAPVAASVVNPAVAAVVTVNETGLPTVENKDVAGLLLAMVGGLKGASVLAIAFAVSKFLLFFLLSPMFTSIFPKLEGGGTKLIIAVGMNLVVGILGLMVTTNIGFVAALTNSSILALASVFANQAYKQFFVKAKV